MFKNRFTNFLNHISKEENRRRKREVILIFIIILLVWLLTIAETQVIQVNTNILVSNAILMFILINISLLLLLLLIFLVFRNLVKLYYDRRHNVIGSSLRMKLVVAFISLTLLPTIILFFFSIHFITTSMKFWFNVLVEEALVNSLEVGQNLYTFIEENHLILLQKTAQQLSSTDFTDPANLKKLDYTITLLQQEFKLHVLEIYNEHFLRITYVLDPKFQPSMIKPIDSDQFQKDMGTKKMRMITEEIQDGELIRSLCAYPFGVQVQDAKGFIVIDQIIPKGLSQKLVSISSGFEEYQQIKLLKAPIQLTYYIALSIVALLVIFCAVWFAFYLAKSITGPLKELSAGIQRIAEGDLNFYIPVATDDEIGSLVDAFNKMTHELYSGREKLALSDKILRQQNAEIEEKRQYMEIVLKNISAGVISLDDRGIVTTINKSSEKLLNVKADEILTKSFRYLLKGQRLQLANEIKEKVSMSRDGIELPVSLIIDGRPRSFLTHVNALKNDKGFQMGMVIVFDDMTEIEKAQRMLAWREVARRIAHEVKNPLTPISLSAQRLKRKYSSVVNDSIFDECTTTIIDHVELIRNLVNEFATFARFPTVNLKPAKLSDIIDETIVLYKDSNPHIEFQIQVGDDVPKINLDRQQMKQALINLIDNAISAIQETGIIRVSLSYDAILKIVRLEVSDTGQGISDEEKTRLFEPYFSTKKTGMGLGLAIVSSIVVGHNGIIHVQDNYPKGAKFVIEFSVS
ncbi:MAG: HAMP domain-containing protein [Desulfobacterales bacterium]|nr:HAMP domain-containing protein [Desulfobacterales bacterium]